jgi:hypothetical protein
MSFADLDEPVEKLAFDALAYALKNAEIDAGGFSPFAFLAHADGSRQMKRYTGAPVADSLEAARREFAELDEAITAIALAWDGFVPTDAGRTAAVLIEVYERRRPTGVLIAQPYQRDDSTLTAVGDPVPFTDTQPLIPERLAPARRGLDEWVAEGRAALRSMVDDLGGDVAAFDREPRSFESTLDHFIGTLPPEELDEDAFGWLETMLVTYLAEVLIHGYGGTWEVVADAGSPSGIRHVVRVDNPGGFRVDVFRLVHDNLRPVPQRIPWYLERALAAAGHYM